MQIPPDLLNAIEEHLDQTEPAELVTNARALSKRMRDRQRAEDISYSELDALAYAGYRMPASYASTQAVLEELRDRLPGFEPRTMLDVGAGPGTAAWAVAKQWPGIEHMTMIEPSSAMSSVGKSLADKSSVAALRHAEWTTFGSSQSTPAYDLTVAAYVLGEIRPLDRTGFIERLWRQTAVACLLIEPGTPAGSQAIEDATVRLTALDATIAAPAPVEWKLVEGPNDWCHFSIRVDRTAFMRRIKDADLSYEDEKFTYVIATKLVPQPIGARVLRHPQIRKGHVRLVLATSSGVVNVVVSKRDREAYRLARHLKWGSALNIDELSLFRL